MLRTSRSSLPFRLICGINGGRRVICRNRIVFVSGLAAPSQSRGLHEGHDNIVFVSGLTATQALAASTQAMLGSAPVRLGLRLRASAHFWPTSFVTATVPARRHNRFRDGSAASQLRSRLTWFGSAFDLFRLGSIPVPTALGLAFGPASALMGLVPAAARHCPASGWAGKLGTL